MSRETTDAPEWERLKQGEFYHRHLPLCAVGASAACIQNGKK
jgi:hypothetical protein